MRLGNAVPDHSPPLKYLGTYKQRTYSEGSCVTHQGSVWYAQKLTDMALGSSADWMLMCKRGGDGKAVPHATWV